jgi:hypothetical protein
MQRSERWGVHVCATPKNVCRRFSERWSSSSKKGIAIMASVDGERCKLCWSCPMLKDPEWCLRLASHADVRDDMPVRGGVTIERRATRMPAARART